MDAIPQPPQPHVPPVPPAPPVSSGKGVRIALGISVALNLAVVGLVAGALLRDGDPRDRDALRREFVERAPEMRDVRRAMRDDLETFLTVLRTEPFDPAALAVVMDNQDGRMARRIELGRDLLLDRLAAMPPEERAAFADRLERRLRRGGGNDGPGRPGGDE
jgi:hypothetical protein